MNSQPTKSESKAPQAMAVEAFGALAGVSILSGFAAGGWGLLAKVPEFVLWSSAAVGIHGVCQPRKEDYMEGVDLARKCLAFGAKETGAHQMIVAPVAQAVAALPGYEDIDRTTPFDVSELLSKSAIITAPTGTGKSFLLSYILCEQERLMPGSIWMVCSKNNWQGQNWAGLKDCPEWLQRKKLAFGWKYLHESPIEVAAHRETDDAVDSLWAEMQRRMKVGMDSQGDCGEFLLNRVWIDEFPSYWDWLESDQGDDNGIKRRDKIRDIFNTGRKYQTVLGVLGVDDAVGKMGLSEADKRQLMQVRPFKPGHFGAEPKACGISQKTIDMVNQLNGRRLLLRFDGMAKVMPIPHCDAEPQIDWSKEIERGEMRTLIDHLANGEMRGWKSFGSKITDAWSEFTQHVTFKGNKAQSMENETYRYFRQAWDGIEL